VKFNVFLALLPPRLQHFLFLSSSLRHSSAVFTIEVENFLIIVNFPARAPRLMLKDMLDARAANRLAGRFKLLLLL
jgi:hypothetical protein